MPAQDTTDFKILLDIPVNDKGDIGAPAAMEHLSLGFDDLSKAISQIILHSDPRFAVGLFGGWGSGKTTLMHAIQQQLPAQETASVWFSAWRYEKEEHLIVPLLDVIREAVIDWGTRCKTAKAKSAAKRLATTIAKVSASLMAGFSIKAGISDALSLSFDANKALTQAGKFDTEEQAAHTPRSFYHASFAAMKGAFESFHQEGANRIVVFVDDLDRCLPEGVLEVLESMKLFFDLDGFIFVVGLDRAVVEMSIEHRYREMQGTTADSDEPANDILVTGERYLQKIFQVPFNLSPVSANQLVHYLDSIKEQADLQPAQCAELDEVIRPVLTYIIGENGFNPREFKRFINEYTIQRKIAPQLCPQVMVALQVIAHRRDWADVYSALRAFRDGFLDALRVYAANGDDVVLAPYMPVETAPPVSFLDFMAPDKPGFALIDKNVMQSAIEVYLSSGAVSGTSEGSEFLLCFREIGELMVTLTRGIENTGTPEALDMMEFSTQIQTAARNLSLDPDGASSRNVLNAIRRAAEDLYRISQLAMRMYGLPEFSTVNPNETERTSVRASLEDLKVDFRKILKDLTGAYSIGR